MSDKILSLIDQYWDIAYQQGVEGRTTDNEAGDAQRVLSEITGALALIPSEPVATVAEMGAGGHRWLVPHPLSALDHLPIGTKLYATPHPNLDREGLLEEAIAALKPFFAPSWVNDFGWTDLACQNDRIVDWFGPSDFRAAASLLSKLEGSSHGKA